MRKRMQQNILSPRKTSVIRLNVANPAPFLPRLEKLHLPLSHCLLAVPRFNGLLIELNENSFTLDFARRDPCYFASCQWSVSREIHLALVKALTRRFNPCERYQGAYLTQSVSKGNSGYQSTETRRWMFRSKFQIIAFRSLHGVRKNFPFRNLEIIFIFFGSVRVSLVSPRLYRIP